MSAKGPDEVRHEAVHAGEHGARAHCLPEPWMCEVFHVDGSLRDVRVLGVTRAEWLAVLERLCAVADETEFEHAYTELDPVRPAPADLLRIWADEPEGRGTTFAFRARFGAVWFFALPYDEEEIEFSLWPEHVEDGAGVSAVLRFLVEVATASRRPALLTAEVVCYDPSLPTLVSHDPDSGVTAHI
ncbi:hypothetical protein Slala02_29060 [Streptomyces lavendulae subsp. lavendulae]|nr:hypothetical protein Slala01_32350 [Streptomyces lavendulae subsp. lavendulae]GLX27086.1 hypothetical protein Slala02_29060 [Streptomyces lavendulae subsp. lavendulae]